MELPHSLEAEQSVIGGVLLHNPAWDDVADMLTVEDFYQGRHRTIWQTLTDMDTANQPFDAVTVADWMSNRGTLDDVGGLEYLTKLASSTPSVANIKTYATRVSDRGRERRMLTALREAESIVRRHGTTDERLDKAATVVQEAVERRTGSGPMQVRDILPGWVDSLEERFEAGGNITGLRTGLHELDEKILGLQPGDLVIVAGRPSMGKSAFGFQVAQHVSVDLSKPVAVFSLEMPNEQIINRMAASLGAIHMRKIRTGDFRDEEWTKTTNVVGMIKNAPLFLDDTPALTPHELRARCRRIKRRHGLELVVVDYLQLMQAPGKENRTNEVSEISRQLKALAKELRVPVIALSQLSRRLEERKDKRPIMADLRESGAIEQDADVILFLYRDEVYNDDSTDKGTAEIIIGKQRNGEVGKVRVVSRLEFSRFENVDTVTRYV